MKTKAIAIVAGLGVALVMVAIQLGSGSGQLKGDALSRDEASKRSALQGSVDLPSSSFQDALLADGLTEGEYDVAFSRYRGCINAAGATFIPDSPTKNTRGTWVFLVTAPPLIGPDGGGTVNRAAADGVRHCDAKYFGAVHARWTAEHLPGHAEIEAAKEGIVACMRDRGIEMPDDLPADWGLSYQGKPAPEGLRIDREAGLTFAGCSQEAAQKLGMAPGDGLVP